MQHLGELLRLTREGVPWALARFNDGEHRAMFQTKKGKKISRGRQDVTPSLRDALLAALGHRQENYWIGLPCSKCYPAYRARQLMTYPGLANYRNLTYAVILSNRNRERFLKEFPGVLRSRRLTWVGPMAQKLGGLPFYPLIDNQIVVPERNAWEFWQSNSTIQPIPPDQVVLLSCGPLARILAHRWFEARPDLTIIDLGSIYDPITMGIESARIHRGTLPPCPECH